MSSVSTTRSGCPHSDWIGRRQMIDNEGLALNAIQRGVDPQGSFNKHPYWLERTDISISESGSTVGG